LRQLAAERSAGPGFHPTEGLGRPDQASSFVADDYFSAFDDPLVASREPGPGDSNYELTFTLHDAEGDPDSDWDAETEEYEPEAPSSDEIPVASPAAEPPGPDSWHHRFIESWGLRLIAAALALIAISVPIIAYLLWRIFGSGKPLDFPTPTLIAGFACAVALLMISVPLLLLAASVTELARDVRRLYQQAEHRGLLGRR
jgi:hypothetical protein